MDSLASLLGSMKKRKKPTEAGAGPKKYARQGDKEKRSWASEEHDSLSGKILGQKEVTSPQSRRLSTQSMEDDEEEKINLTEAEVIRRFRQRGAPIKLFGEVFVETFRRLRKLELEEPLDVVLERQTNDYQRALNEVDDENALEDIGQNKKTSNKLIDRHSWDFIQQRVYTELGKGDTNLDQYIIRQFWKYILEMLERDLEGRPADVKRTAEGRDATATFKQTESYLKPLLKHLKKKTTPEEIVPLLTEIALCTNDREYSKAIDAYLRMAIGTAAWPIGVTNVGIHSRTGREKIFAQHIAHVLNDETQRKYITAMKRLIKFCQTKFPTDPSKCMEYDMAANHLYPTQKAE